MALLKNKKNKNIIKDIKDEHKISLYLGTGDWEIVEKIIQPEVKEELNKDKK